MEHKHLEVRKGVIRLAKQEQVLNVYVQDGKIVFEENCDEYFAAEYTPEEAMQMLEELKQEIARYSLKLNNAFTK